MDGIGTVVHRGAQRWRWPCPAVGGCTESTRELVHAGRQETDDLLTSHGYEGLLSYLISSSVWCCVVGRLYVCECEV